MLYDKTKQKQESTDKKNQLPKVDDVANLHYSQIKSVSDDVCIHTSDSPISFSRNRSKRFSVVSCYILQAHPLVRSCRLTD